MAQRDYAGKKSNSKKKSGGSRKALLIIALLLVAGFALGLFWLKQKSMDQVVPTVENTTETRPKSQLPSRPEETWSYIKELESRTVISDNSQAALDKMAKLTDKQKEELKRLQQAEQKSALEKAKRAEETTAVTVPPTVENTTTPSNDEAALKAEQEQKLAEQKKLEEQRKKAEAKKAEETKLAAAKKTEPAKASGQFGLQCGAFNDRGKAENLQGRLAMAGLNAKIVQSGNWNRVLVGPVGDRAAASSAQQQANSIINCVIIGM